MTRRRTLIGVVVAVAGLLLVGRIISGLFIDYEWYSQMHATSLWVAQVVNRVLLTGSIAAITTLFVFANLYAVRRSIVSVVLPRRLANVEIGEELPGRYLTGATAVVSVVLGVLLALPPEPWMELAMARYGLPFGYTDPYFNFDLGFFVYWLPLENALYVRTLLVLVGTVFVVAVLYVAVTPSLRWDRSRFRLTAHVRRHSAALTPLFFAVVAWNYRLDAYAVLTHGSGPAGLFTGTDHHFVIPAERMLALLLLAGGVVTAFALWRNQVKTALIWRECVAPALGRLPCERLIGGARRDRPRCRQAGAGLSGCATPGNAGRLRREPTAHRVASRRADSVCLTARRGAAGLGVGSQGADGGPDANPAPGRARGRRRMAVVAQRPTGVGRGVRG